jgi:beta-lactamase class A
VDDIVFTGPVTPLFLEPRAGGEIADEALCGMAASVLGEENGMLQVRMRYRYEGYVAPEGVIRGGQAREWESAASHVVTAPAADVMSEPRYESEALATLPRGAVLRVADSAADCWLAASLADGTRGYVRSPSVRKMRLWVGDEGALRAGVVSDALMYLGAQYRWGGKSHYGVDCSGLASMAYMLNGLYIFRDARIADGYPVREIPAGSAKAGDLLYWDGHVAVYLGDGRYIHSTQRSSGVVINSLDPAHPDFREDLADVARWGSVFAGRAAS